MYLLFESLEPPRDVVIVSVGWSHLILSWISPFNGTAIDFADSYLLIVSTNKEKVMNITTTKTHARIDGLKQMTYYLVSLQAWNKLGYGPPLNPDIHFRTLGNRTRNKINNYSTSARWIWWWWIKVISYPTSVNGIIVLLKTLAKYREFFPTCL